jgi:hypothetical protein
MKTPLAEVFAINDGHVARHRMPVTVDQLLANDTVGVMKRT